MANLSSVITQTVGTSVAGINLITAPNESSIWNATTISKSTTTTAAELPLGPAIPTATKFSLSASPGSAYADFDCPQSLTNGKLNLGWYARASTSFTATISLTLQSFSSASNRTAGTSPTSVTLQTSTVQGLAPSFFTSFDANSQLYYRLTINFTGLAAAWYAISQFQVGPGTTQQVPAVGNWQTWIPSSTQGFGTISSVELEYCQVGSSIFIRGRFTTGILSASEARIALPANCTIAGTSSSPIAVGKVSRAQSAVSHISVIATKGSSYLTFGLLNYGTAHNPLTSMNGSDIASNSTAHSIEAGPIPISEWASSGVIMGQGAQVEYAFNTTSTNTNGIYTSNKGYGSQGTPILAYSLTAGQSAIYECDFQYPIQTDDLLILEVDNGTSGQQWVDATARGFAFQQNDAGSSFYGMSIQIQSSTSIRVTFYSTPSKNVANWSSLTTWRWRVRKAKASAPVGFGLAGNGVSGLVSSEYASAEGDLGTVGWSGTAPSGTSSKKYKWYRVGKMVVFEFRVEHTVAGASNSQISFALPSGVPSPALFSTGALSTWQVLGTGGISRGLSDSLNTDTNQGASALYRGASGDFTVYAYSGPSAGIAAKCAMGTLTWITA